MALGSSGSRPENASSRSMRLEARLELRASMSTRPVTSASAEGRRRRNISTAFCITCRALLTSCATSPLKRANASRRRDCSSAPGEFMHPPNFGAVPTLAIGGGRLIFFRHGVQDSQAPSTAGSAQIKALRTVFRNASAVYGFCRIIGNVGAPRRRDPTRDELTETMLSRFVGIP